MKSGIHACRVRSIRNDDRGYFKPIGNSRKTRRDGGWVSKTKTEDWGRRIILLREEGAGGTAIAQFMRFAEIRKREKTHLTNRSRTRYARFEFRTKRKLRSTRLIVIKFSWGIAAREAKRPRSFLNIIVYSFSKWCTHPQPVRRPRTLLLTYDRRNRSA